LAYSSIAGLVAPWKGNAVLDTIRLPNPGTVAVSTLVVMDSWVYCGV